MSGKTVFVTGASGAIGGGIVRAAVAKGYQVRGLSRNEASDEKIKSLGAIPVRGDLKDLDVLAREAANAEISCHAADAFVGSKFAIPYEESVKITNAAIDAMAGAIEGTNKGLVTASAARIVGPKADGSEATEDDPYEPNPDFDRVTPSEHAVAWAKRGVRVSTVRIAPLVHGHGTGGIDALLKMTKGAGEATTIDGGNVHTAAVHVDDSGRLFILAGEKSAPGECYNCVGENGITFGEVIHEIADAVGVPVVDVNPEVALTKLGPVFGDYLTRPARFSTTKAGKLLGWEPEEIGILEDIRSGSYEALKAELNKPTQA